MTRIDLTAVVVGVVGSVVAIVWPTAIVSANSTQRQANCLEAGGSYVRVANTSAMECQR